jgi:hypothetical protein
MDSDPYENLEDGLVKRKNAYLRALAARDVALRPAFSRGFLRKVPGNKVNVNGKEELPQVMEEERKAAKDLGEKKQAFWTDTPALREAAPEMPLDFEDVNLVITRMAAADLPQEGAPFVSFPPWFIQDLPFPKPDDLVHARQILTFSYHVHMKVWVRKIKDGEEMDEYEDVIIQDWVKRQLEKAKAIFPDQKLIDRIRTSFDKPAPGKDTPVPAADVVNAFTKVQIEG